MPNSDETGGSTPDTSQPRQLIQVNIPLPPKLELKGNLATNWKKFKRMWTNYEIASRLRNENNELRTATLLTCIGPDALEIYDGLPFESETDKVNIDVVLQKLETLCVGETNETYERYCFNKRDQEAGESIETYVASIRSLAKTCNYGELANDLIRDRIVVGIRDNSVRKHLLRESKLTLKSCVDICRASECTAQQLKAMRPTEDVHAMGQKPQRNLRQKKEFKSPHVTQPRMVDCIICGKTHVKKKEECPAWGKTCTKCDGKKHFAPFCTKGGRQRKYKQVQTVECKHDEEYGEEDDDEYLLTVLTEDPEYIDSVKDKEYPKKIFTTLELKGKQIKFQLDCGATVNIIPEDVYQSAFHDPNLEQLQKANTTLVMYNKSEITALGKLTAETLNPKNDERYLIEYLIVSRGLNPLLGARTIQQLHLMNINEANIMSMDTEDRKKVLTQSDITDSYADVFAGEGALEGKLHLEIDESVPPVKLPVRKVPIAVRGQLKEELDRLSAMGIIEPVDVPTDWISSMVVTTKRNGKLRLCIDPKPLNQALKRNHYPLPSIDDLLPDLANAKVFSVADAKNGFWHVELDTESSYLTTFGTPWGRYRWLRMPFGISPAPEEFQKRLDAAMEGLEGVVPIFDDSIVFGVGDTYEAAVEDHDRKLTAFLQRCRGNRNQAKQRYVEAPFTRSYLYGSRHFS